MDDVPRSKIFDDIYFSVEDGLAESQFVFLKGNHLPERLQGQKNFTVAETGFGTGLNFLALWDLIDSHAPDLKLHYVSYEKYPLTREEIEQALSRWKHVFGNKVDTMLAQYPLRVEGFHSTYLTPNIKLTLVFGDVNETIVKTQNIAVDAWFLDGFTPAKNPQMWTKTLFDNMARLSAPEATFATFTAAGDVKRGLMAAGFDVEKTDGFGRKRDRLIGRFGGAGVHVPDLPQSVAIVGAGIAGCSIAYWLQQEGVKVHLFEEGDAPAQGASGNPAGMINPRFYKLRCAEGHFYWSAYARALQFYEALSQIHDVDFESCGALHLCTNEDKQERFQGLLENWGYPEDVAQFLSKEETREVAGRDVPYQALYLPNSARISPAKLCAVLSQDMPVTYKFQLPPLGELRNEEGWQINGDNFDALVLAVGAGFDEIEALKSLSESHKLKKVRGQLSQARATEKSMQLTSTAHYGGYILPPKEGVHVIGSTFQPWETSTELRRDDDVYNKEKLTETLPELAQGLAFTSCRASLRVSSRAYFPVFGKVEEGLYVSLAHGSHGLTSTPKVAQMLFNPLEKTDNCL